MQRSIVRDVKINYSLEEQLKSGDWKVNWNAVNWKDFMSFKNNIFRPPLDHYAPDVDSSNFLIHNQACERFVGHMKYV